MSIDFKGANEYSFGCLQNLTEGVFIDISKKGSRPPYTQGHLVHICM